VFVVAFVEPHTSCTSRATIADVAAFMASQGPTLTTLATVGIVQQNVWRLEKTKRWVNWF